MINNLEILEKIMEPYFAKKDQIDNVISNIKNDKLESKMRLSEEKENRHEKIKSLEIELENLRVKKTFAIKEFEEKKEKEIEEYISKAIDSNSRFFTSYGSMLRKDLEQEYEKQLERIQNEFKMNEENILLQIKELKSRTPEEKVEIENLEQLSKPYKYRNVDLREMVELKNSLRKQLFAERKRLNEEFSKFKEEIDYRNNLKVEILNNQKKLSEVNEKLSNFKYEYNEQNQLINGSDWRILYEESRKISDRLQEMGEILSKESEAEKISQSLIKVEEYIKMTELTQEETSAVMMSMTHWEKEEYDRRKGNIDVSEPILNKKTEIISNEHFETKAGLLKTMFEDIIKEVKNLRGIKLTEGKGEEEAYIDTKSSKSDDYKNAGTINFYDPENESLNLPSGEYLYSQDIIEAVENLYNKDKNKTYTVKGTNKKFKLTRFSIAKFKLKLKECSLIRLLKDKKISKIDITRVFGKSKTEGIFRKLELGTVYGNPDMPEGDYVSRNELIAKLNNLFTTNKFEWLRKLSDKLKFNSEEATDEQEKTKVK